MDILFKKKRLAKRMASKREMVKAYGTGTARKVRLRLDQLRAADHLGQMRYLPGRCHELTGDRKGEIAIDLDGPNRLLFEPADDPPPTKDDGGLDWEKVTAISILGVEDYHG